MYGESSAKLSGDRMQITTVLQIVGAASPFVLLIVGAVLKRRLDAAQADKTKAEAHVQDAIEAKTRQEAAGLVIDHASKLIDEFREYQSEKDKLAAERLAAEETRSSLIEKRMARMEEAFSSLRAVLATHGVWDAAALVELRHVRKDYPAPPPLPDSLKGDI